MPMIVGALQIVFSVLVGPFLLAFVGNWLGGEADPSDIRQAVAWSYAPFAVVGLVWVPIIMAYGGVPTAPVGEEEPILWGLALAGLAVLTAALWTLWLEVVMLAEAQRFSIWRAVINIGVFVVPVLLFGALR